VSSGTIRRRNIRPENSFQMQTGPMRDPMGHYAW
jgi:hypothetical protein